MSLYDKLVGVHDKFVAVTNPKKALKNKHIRNALEKFEYRAARQTRISGMKMGLGGTADDHAKETDLWMLREFSRELDRNNLLASSILDRGTEAVIGTGIDIQLLSGSKRWDANAEAMFKEWWEEESDVRGMLSGWEMEKLAFRTVKVDGDMLLIKVNNGQIQAVEGDRIATPPSKVSDKNTINGVELNSVGKPIRFWVAETVVNSRTIRTLKSDKNFRPIPAEDVIFLANPKRFSQTRGVPIFATNMQLFEDIDAFIEACLIGAKISVSHVMFIEREEGAAAVDNVHTVEDDIGDERQEQTISPGMILRGKPGEKATNVGSTQQMVQFTQFITQLLRFTGLSFGMPLEMISLDFSRTNYSSARAALLVAWWSFKAQHKFMVTRMMSPIVRWKIQEWQKKGLLKDRPNGYRIGATPPRMLSIDPLKEGNADVIRTQHGFSTNREVCAALGFDWQDIFDQRSVEISQAIKLAEKITADTGAKVDWRDLMGDAKNFDAGVYQEPEMVVTEDQNV